MLNEIELLGMAVYLRQMDDVYNHGLLPYAARKELNCIIHGSPYCRTGVSLYMKMVVAHVLNHYPNIQMDYNVRYTINKLFT